MSHDPPSIPRQSPTGPDAAEGIGPGRILVRGVNWLGDAVLTTPALLRLRERFPDALIVMLTPEKLRGLWLHHPAVDEIITFKRRESIWRVASKVQVMMWPEAEPRPGRGEAADAARVEVVTPREPSSRRTFDLAVIFPNSPRSALEVWLARIPRRVGYARPWRRLLLTDPVPPRPGHALTHKRSIPEIRRLIARAPEPCAPPLTERGLLEPVHQVHDYLHLVAALGANPEPLPPQLVVTPGEIKTVMLKFNLGPEFTGNRPLLGLNPGAEYGPAKRWPADRFIAAANEIQKRTRCLWLVLGGKGDADIARQIEAGIQGAETGVRNLAGQTSLRELCVVLKLCRGLLTNDTGPMHVAAALGTPVVVPFGSTAPDLTGPAGPGGPQHRLLRSQAPCAPCFRRTCPIDFRCMAGIGVAEVVEAMMEALEPVNR